MTLREEWKNKVNLRWFVLQYQELLKNLVTSKSDNATFSKEYADKQKITVPHIALQEQISNILEKVGGTIMKLEELKENAIKLTQSRLIG